MATRIRKSKMRIVQVLTTAPVNKIYDYLAPDGMGLEVGDYVLAPLGPRAVPGVVWAVKDQTDSPSAKLKVLLEKYDLPSMSGEMRGFIDWVAKYNMAPCGSVLKMAVSVPQGLEAPKPLTGYVLAEETSFSPSAFLSRNPHLVGAKKILSDGLPRRLSELSREAGISSSAIKTLLKNQVIVAVDLFAKAPCMTPDPDFQKLKLSPEQKSAALALTDCLKQKKFETFLLDGVTGAGKTEVYFEAIAETIHSGQQSLVLL
ncbi:MAG: DEAD/DEAH box helicase family protein, partial [Alphaproteobacteria bacterium]|nr:DEAD/DEAH box helicase family protein [Alphaproteobacteria bacterium]